MAVPERVRVKLLSEAAGYMNSTRVMQRDFTAGELMDAVVAVAGKNVERIRQLLRTGTIVAGEYRHRWEGFDASAEELAPLLARFPDPRPERAFEPSRCVHASIRSGVETLELPREETARTRLLRTRSFWDALMQLAQEHPPRYQTYSYRLRADVYVLEPAGAEVEHLHEAAVLLTNDRLAERFRRLPVEKILLSVNR